MPYIYYMMKTTQEMSEQAIRKVIDDVVSLGDERGYKHDPRGFASAQDLLDAVEAGIITKTSRGWGHRLTDKGRSIHEAEVAKTMARHAELNDAGFDPTKKVSDMTPEEIEQYIAWSKAQ